MDPTLHDADYLLANKLIYLSFNPESLKEWLTFINVEGEAPVFACHPPSQRDVVIFSRENPATGYFVKRVVGEPGDLVEIRRGQIFDAKTLLIAPGS